MIEGHLALLSQELKGLACELQLVVTGDGEGRSQRVPEEIQHIGQCHPSDGGIDMECLALMGTVIDQIQATEAPHSGKCQSRSNF